MIPTTASFDPINNFMEQALPQRNITRQGSVNIAIIHALQQLAKIFNVEIAY